LGAGTEAGSAPSSVLGSVAPLGRPTPRWLSAGLTLVSVLVFSAWLLLAAVHVDDRYQLDHVSGVRIALARYFTDGTLYPELYDGSFYGGSRFMPLPIVLHGALASLTGEFLVAGKLLAYGVMLALLGVMLGLLRSMRCPLPIAVALLASVVATRTGLAAGMGLRADTLPLLLQLLAVAAVARSRRPAATVAASALAALAFVSKLSAVWAPLAICVWLLVADRRRLAWFLAAYGGMVAALLAFFAALTHNRIFENVFGLSTAGVGAGSVLRGPNVLMHLLVAEAITTWALLPVAAVAAWLAIRQRHADIYLVSLACCLAVLVVVLSDVGTGSNQLIDLVALTALVVGGLAGRLRQDLAASVAVPTAVALILLWANLTGLVVNLVPDARQALSAAPGARSYSRQPLSGQATPATTLLSEDPYVPVSLGQRPIVLDPFMLQRLGRRDPAALERLVDRIRTREFELVVLVVPLQPVDQEWWRDMHFGTRVAQALAASYRPIGRAQGYYLYRPAPAGTSGGAG
jgi:hypothetical protein